jgi:hypothetical protein
MTPLCRPRPPRCEAAAHRDLAEPARAYRQQFELVRAWVREKGDVAARNFFHENARRVYKWVDRQGEAR